MTGDDAVAWGNDSALRVLSLLCRGEYCAAENTVEQ
jgi:hypothetical protein